MDSLLSIFLLFIAAITALLTYMFIPHVPVVALVSAAAIALAAGIWWHWMQFSIDYRTSTWQEQLRNYASYAMVLLVILLSYGFYVFAYSGSTLQEYAAQAGTAIRNAGRRASEKIIGGTTRALTATQSALFSEATEEPVGQPAAAASTNMRARNTLGF
jgi:NADH:ubiquinone oxidoreductase subunit 6 (subunit J)